jgi:hypothetical protein
METSTDEYKYCNHHHEIGDSHKLVDFGNGEFVANKDAIQLLKALNEIGLLTRTHHIEKGKGSFVSILLDDQVDVEIRTVNEIHANRTEYDGKKELLIRWEAKD